MCTIRWDVSKLRPMRAVSSRLYTSRDIAIKSRIPLGNSNVCFFNQRGGSTSNFDPLGNTILNAYDGRNRLLQRTFPEGNYALYSYDSSRQSSQHYVSSQVGFRLG